MGSSLNKRQKTIRAVALIFIVSGLIGASLALRDWHDRDRTTERLVPAVGSALDLGITYLMVSQQISEHYRLGYDSGALVTRVTIGGLADRAGIRSGDVILTFNGESPGSNIPLLGMMRRCQPGQSVVMEIWRDNTCHVVELKIAAK